MRFIHPKYFFPQNFRQNPGVGYTQMRVIHPSTVVKVWPNLGSVLTYFPFSLKNMHPHKGNITVFSADPVDIVSVHVSAALCTSDKPKYSWTTVVNLSS